MLKAMRFAPARRRTGANRYLASLSRPAIRHMAHHCTSRKQTRIRTCAAPSRGAQGRGIARAAALVVLTAFLVLVVPLIAAPLCGPAPDHQTPTTCEAIRNG